MPETTVRSFKYDMMSKYNFTYITQQMNCLYWHSYVEVVLHKLFSPNSVFLK